jgi:hypothetical protein
MISTRKFYLRVHTVALMPCTFARGSAADDPLAASMEAFRWRIDSLLVLTLEDAGLRVVPGSRLRSLRDSLLAADTSGAGMDEAAADSARLERASRAARELVASRSRPDAWVQPAVVVRKAELSNGKARWDGVECGITSESTLSMIGKHLRLRLADADAVGTQPALSLLVQIVDTDGQLLVERRGGLCPLFRVANGRLELLDGADCLSDRVAGPRAVHAALDVLTDEALYPRVPKRKLK